MAIKTYEDIQNILEKIANYKSNATLEEILITWIECESSIDLVFIPAYKYTGHTITSEHPMVAIASFPKTIDTECVIDQSVKNCCDYGKKIYYHFRKGFQLRRDLSKHII